MPIQADDLFASPYPIGSVAPSTGKFTTLEVTGALTQTGAAAFTGNITITKADPSLIFNTVTATDTDFWMGIQEDAGGDNDDAFQIGLGTSPGTTPILSLSTTNTLTVAANGANYGEVILAGGSGEGGRVQLQAGGGGGHTYYVHSVTSGSLRIVRNDATAATSRISISNLNGGGGALGMFVQGAVEFDGAFQFDAGGVINEGAADVDTRIEGNSLAYMLFLDGSAATENIALLTTAAPNWQTMDRGLFIGNSSTIPTGNPTGGGFLYVEAGALKYRGTSGTITTVGPA